MYSIGKFVYSITTRSCASRLTLTSSFSGAVLISVIVAYEAPKTTTSALDKLDKGFDDEDDEDNDDDDDIHDDNDSESDADDDDTTTDTGNVISLSGLLRRQFAYTILLQHFTDSLICSPLSALMPLGKLALGASGDTLKELLEAIGSKDLSEMKRNFKVMIGELLATKKVTINICSAIFVHDDHQLTTEFRKQAEEIFGADVESVDFSDSSNAAKEINNWVSKNTKNTINDLIHESAISRGTTIILVNAVYFSGQWKYPFSKAREGIFHAAAGKQNVHMMQQRQQFFYHNSSALRAQIIEIPYECRDRMSMIIVLPTSENPRALEMLLRALKVSPDMLNDALKKMTIHKVNLSIPKFKIETSFDLGQQYAELGLKGMFHNGLDKMARDGDLNVTQAIQSAVVQVDEKGTMAAAASAVINMMSSHKYKNAAVNFTANRPFYFILLARGEQLFSGVLNDIYKE